MAGPAAEVVDRPVNCPACRSEDVRVGWPEGQDCYRAHSVVVPLSCKACSHTWTVRKDVYKDSGFPPTEGERADREEARA